MNVGEVGPECHGGASAVPWMRRFALSALAFLLAPWLGSAGAESHSASASRPPISLPRDHAMHPWAHSEWWYVVGHLRDRAVRRYGFETTLFKLNHLQFPGSKQLFAVDRADVTLTNVSRHKFIPSVRYVQPGGGPASLSTRTLDERVGASRLWIKGQSIDLSSWTRGHHLMLTFRSRRSPLLEGGKGIVPMGKGGFSYYYSLPNLAVSGHILYQGRLLAVHGIAWMDHQWGVWDWSKIRGWRWGELQLTNGVDFSIADFRASGGSLHGSTISFTHGGQRTFQTIRIKPLGYWRSPRGKAIYSSGWLVTIPGVRGHLFVRPMVKDQEVYDKLEPAASYWEGACSVKGTFQGKRVTGEAYMELVGARGHFGSFR